METMKEIDDGLKQTEATARRDYLIRQLNRLGVSKTIYDSPLDKASLYALEMTHIQEKNKVARKL